MKRKLFAIIIFLAIFFSAPFVISEFGFDEDATGRIAGIAFIGLICVLFSEGLGSYTGPMWSVGRIGTHIGRTSPPGIVEFLGWILLFVLILVFLLAVIY